MFVDAHCHLSLLKNPQDLLSGTHFASKSSATKVDYFLQGGVDSEEWQQQLALKKQYPNKIGLCFGLHPYSVHRFFIEKKREQMEGSLDALAPLLSEALFLGELGLDFRHTYLESMDWQLEALSLQLEMARFAHKPLVLHVVRAYPEVIQALDMFYLSPADIPEKSQADSKISDAQLRLAKWNGLVHGFSGSLQDAVALVLRGFYLSVGIKNIKGLVKKGLFSNLPFSCFLIESDLDRDQDAPFYYKNLEECLKILSDAYEVTEESILQGSTDRVKALITNVKI